MSKGEFFLEFLKITLPFLTFVLGLIRPQPKFMVKKDDK